jgi:FkbM family methyltransferase
MRLADLEAENRKTLHAAKDGKASVSRPMDFPFHGYYEADIFECPPFLMYTNNDCPRALNILFGRSFEPTSMRIWCRLARTASGILDIGASVGVYSLAAAALRRDIAIHAFEPNPHAYTRLRMHKLLNKFDHIQEHTFAVGDRNEYVNFSWAIKAFVQISSGGGVNNNKKEQPGWESVVVPMRALDGTGLAGQVGDRGLIKIDVEGGEPATFRGMTEILARKPDIILETFSADACAVINPMIRALGYSVYQIIENEKHVTANPELLPCSTQGENFNQFLTTRSVGEVAALLA